MFYPLSVVTFFVIELSGYQQRTRRRRSTATCWGHTSREQLVDSDPWTGLDWTVLGRTGQNWAGWGWVMEEMSDMLTRGS